MLNGTSGKPVKNRLLTGTKNGQKIPEDMTADLEINRCEVSPFTPFLVDYYLLTSYSVFVNSATSR